MLFFVVLRVPACLFLCIQVQSAVAQQDKLLITGATAEWQRYYVMCMFEQEENGFFLYYAITTMWISYESN